jgi:hypothetical protein
VALFASCDGAVLVAASKGGNPFSKAAFALVATLLSFGAMLFIGAMGWQFLRRIAMFLLGLSVLWLRFTIVALFSGFRRFYVYDGGSPDARARSVPAGEDGSLSRP